MIEDKTQIIRPPTKYVLKDVEKVNELVYLGSLIQTHGDSSK